MPKPFIHPSTPKRLVRAFRSVKWKWHPLADLLDVNIAILYSLIHYGKEPNNPEIRIKVFLPRHRRQITINKILIPKPPLPPHINWWKCLTKEQRSNWILFTYHYQENQNARHDPQSNDL